MEGSCKVINGTEVIIGYHSRGRKKVANCKYRPSGYATFFVDKNKFGTGNKGNPLFPHFSVACDQTKFRFGQWFFIPLFVGVELPNGRKHEGYFRCDDIGGLIKGNHFDFFIGKVENWKKHPFLKLATGEKILEVYLVKGKK
jgi:3D (Asp-Asp-Asp) domain-containing protein